MNETSLKATPLHELHKELGATMVAFAGYSMPVRFPLGILGEHLHVRGSAGLFDVSHMGAILIEGEAELYESFERLVPSDILGMQPGTVRYSLLLNERGGAIDDLMVMRPASDRDMRSLLLIVNAACKEGDLEHLRLGLDGKARVELLGDRAILSLQGPMAEKILSRYCDAPGKLKFMQCGEFSLSGFGEAVISRSGYTGEDGFEVLLGAEDAESFSRSLLTHPELAMIGLGARDSLRLEAGLPLYGHDLDGTTTPVEAGLAWIIPKRRREGGGFPGFSIVRHELAQGPARRRVGIRVQDKAIAREGAEIQSKGKRTGVVTSGGYGPSVSGPIAMGYVETESADHGASLELIVRGKALPGTVVEMPFVAHRYAR